MNIQQRYTEATVTTANNLKSVAHSKKIQELSTLSLPEIEAVVNLVARVIPAGNVPGMILNGLARLPGRRPPLQTLQRDINLIFRGVEQSLDKALYSAFFAGPAAVIWGYQNLLKLAGKDPADSFPEGVWQFYADYALREDTARHANETHGFDTLLNRHQIHLSPVDRVTAWLMAAIHTLHQYDDLLKNEWRERVYTYLLREITRNQPEADRYARLYREWARQQPYGRGQDAAPNESYPTYRRVRFDRFLEQALADLPPNLRRAWVEQAQAAKQQLAAYQQQMSIRAYLEPGSYGESRVPIPLKETHVGLIYRGSYYLIPACLPGAAQPADANRVRMQVAAVMHQAVETPSDLTRLAQLKRREWPHLRRQLSDELVQEINRLRLAPILFNCGPGDRHLPLSELRQTERGLGDHALTLFDTGETMVFDQSHIFFDGAWGAALAEIMTQEALAWAVYLSRSSLPTQPTPPRPQPVNLAIKPADLELIKQSPRVTPEAGAETQGVNIKAMLRLRTLFKKRNDLLQLTVNDLLVLYRAIHAASYQPDPNLITNLRELTKSGPVREAALAALEAINTSHEFNPAIVIPVDASQRSPRERLYPMTFEAPLAELDLLDLHERVIAALDAYQGGAGDWAGRYDEFDRLQRVYLATLAGFGAVLSKAKEVAIAGESVGVGAIKLLAHLPVPLQRMLDAVPNRFEVLNDLIKGREVFSNVGAVAASSTLLRFITAKDDNDRKKLAWGVITDAQGVMRISLRDFRPHVGLLAQAGRKDLATWLVQDYLDAYVRGLNDFIDDLRRITETSRETGLIRLEQQK